jgi:hypothetical protein
MEYLAATSTLYSTCSVDDGATAVGFHGGLAPTVLASAPGSGTVSSLAIDEYANALYMILAVSELAFPFLGG